MVKRFSQWKRLLAAFLTLVMLFSNNVGVLEAFAEGEETTSNLDLNAKIVVNDNDGVVDAGETFQYVLEYNTPDRPSAYSGTYLTFTLPDYVELVTDSEGNYMVHGEEYDYTTYSEAMDTYTVTFKVLAMHATNSLTIDMKTNNLVTPHNLVLDFNKGFEFQTQYEGVPEIRDVKAGTITTNAVSNWQITKENLTSVDGNNYKKIGTGANATFEVTYRVEVNDVDGIHRLGRLGFEKYEVTDLLPTNLPANGAAKHIKEVKLVRDDGPVALTEGVDYTVDRVDGAPVSITFKDHDKIREGETSGYSKVGDATHTTYEYTVEYPYAPYTTSGDQPNITMHNLVNTAQLNYKLYGEKAKQKTADAQVNIGAYEDNVMKNNIKVEKFIKFTNGEPQKLTAELAEKYGFDTNPVKFTLYTDPDCTNIAYNTQRVLMNNVEIDATGTATFPHVRKGTYYIKEVSTHTGWKNAGVIPVTISNDGKVSYPDGATSFTAVNTAVTINAVEFTKTGVDAYNQQSSGLAGATFTLSDETNTFIATSDAGGKVRFDNVPDGTYTLKETDISEALKEKGYEVSDVTYPVQVAGGQVVTPNLTEGNTYKNTSTKGLLKIIKVDAQNKATMLSNAVFQVYGPYETNELATAAISNPTGLAATLTTGADGTINSGPLEKGYYVLVETQAPINYTAGEASVVQVTERELKEVSVENNPQAKVRFTKKGIENDDSIFVQELAGAEFEIYDEDGNRLYGVQDKDGNYTNVSTDAAGRVEVTITTELDPTGVSVSNYVTLSPGTYKYKETKAPAPFTPDSALKEFVVGSVSANGDGSYHRT